MTYIKLNDYWKDIFSTDVNKNIYMRIVDFYDAIFDRRFNISYLNNMIRYLQLEENGIQLIDETIDNCDDTVWKTKRKCLECCLDGIKTGSLDVNKIGVYAPEFWNSKTMDAANYRQYSNYVESHIRNSGKFVLIKLNGIRITAIEE